MPHWLLRFFRDIRSRPRRERAILAGITYATAATVVIAFWVTSFRTALDLGTETSPGLPAAPVQTPLRVPEVPPELATPFKSLGEGIRQRLEALRPAVPETARSAPPWFAALGDLLRYNLDLLNDGFISFYRYWTR